MAHECQICANEERAAIVNEMLWKKEKGVLKIKYQEIAAQVGGTSTSSVNRHAHGNCRFSFLSYKAARLKAKGKQPVDGRYIAVWPLEVSPPDVAGKMFSFGSNQPIAQDELRPATDVLFVVRYREIKFAPFQLGFDAVIDEAIAENLERFPKLELLFQTPTP
jgi:hypothetical protein